MARLWAWLRDALRDDDEVRLASKLRAFEIILVLVLGTEFWVRDLRTWSEVSPRWLAHAVVASVLCIVVLAGRLRRPAFALLGLNHLLVIAWKFPSSGNHDYLETLLCFLAAFLRLDDVQERRTYLGAVRWMVAVIFFFSGVQKLVHGYWTQGIYLAWAIGSTETFRGVLGPLLPAEEVARLVGYRGEVGDGPYRVASVPLLAVSNLTWVSELALGPLLIWRRTRTAALGLAVGLLLAIELGAREGFFGLVFLDMIALFVPGDANRWLIAPVAALLAWVVLAMLGVVPPIVFM